MIGNKNIESITGDNLSAAWCAALIRCYDSPGAILSPAIVHFPVRAGIKLETVEIRKIVERHLTRLTKSIPKTSVVETIAGTIFPQSIWQHSHGDRDLLFKHFKKMIPFIKRCPANRRGHYFQRMIAYLPNSESKEPINQLEHIIKTWHKGNHRRSALQAGIFDPSKDHSDIPRPGFPCLQQIAFHPKGTNGKDGLSIIAFYANQTVVEKAYGNYLGLYRLGVFMAKEMKLQLSDVVCIASALKLNDTTGKSCCNSLVKVVKKVING